MKVDEAKSAEVRAASVGDDENDDGRFDDASTTVGSIVGGELDTSAATSSGATPLGDS